MLADLSVGENLRDHVFPLGIQFYVNATVSANEQHTKTMLALVNFLVFGQGHCAGIVIVLITWLHVTSRVSDVQVSCRHRASTLLGFCVRSCSHVTILDRMFS